MAELSDILEVDSVLSHRRATFSCLTLDAFLHLQPPSPPMGRDLERANAALQQENAALRAALRRLSRMRAALASIDDAGGSPAASLAAATPHGAPPAMAPSGVSHEEALESFRQNGFLLVDGVLEGEELTAVQRDYAALTAPLRQQWEEGVRDNEQGIRKEAVYVRKAMEQSDALLSLIDRPKLLPLLTDIIGGDVQLRQVQVQSVMPTHDAGGGGYVNWHRDKGNYAHSTRSIWVKAFIYFSDVPADGGCTTLVPGSHTGDAGPPPGFAGFSTDGVAQEEMPGAVRVVRKAGDALLFDTRSWHTALPNTSGHSRDNIILNYCPFWHKRFGDMIAGVDRLDAQGKLKDPMRRQLLGLELFNQGSSQGARGSNPYSERYTESNPRQGARW